MKRMYSLLLILALFIFGCGKPSNAINIQETADITLNNNQETISLEQIPDYTGSPYIVINNNIPFFSESDQTTDSYESYSQLDDLGRCGVAMACIGKDLMPTEDRESISEVKPSGWINHEYSADLVDGRYIYNRCHLIGFQLTGENANEKNLITGTRYMNVEGMLPFENMVADYIKETGNHVLYRVTPIFEDQNMVADGILMEAQSMEDDDILFNVYCYNVQPGIEIDYATGENWKSNSGSLEINSTEDYEEFFILNVNTKKFHKSSCNSVKDININNKKEYYGDRAELLQDGYSPCGNCNP